MHKTIIIQIANDLVATISESGEIAIGEKYLRLTPTEIDIVRVLCRNYPKVSTPSMFLSEMYLKNKEADQKIIDVYICLLRKKLHTASAGAEVLIESIWGRGHVFYNKSLPKNEFASNKYLPEEPKRWLLRIKASILSNYLQSHVTLADILERYPDLSEVEFDAWMKNYHMFGPQGLRVTKKQLYEGIG